MIVAAALAASASGTSGCIDAASCDRSTEANLPERYTGGTTVDGVYQSAPWTEDYLDFPGGKRYELVHGLGAVPTSVDVYYAFGPNPGDGGVTQCGGSTCLFMPDDQVIRVRNDSCTEFWIRVVARLQGSRSPVSDSGVLFSADADGNAPDGMPPDRNAPAADAPEVTGEP